MDAALMRVSGDARLSASSTCSESGTTGEASDLEATEEPTSGRHQAQAPEGYQQPTLSTSGHDYLPGLESVRSSVVLQSWSTHSLPLLPLLGNVLVPFETMPLIERDVERSKQCVRTALAAPAPATGFVACINAAYLARSLQAELWPPPSHRSRPVSGVTGIPDSRSSPRRRVPPEHRAPAAQGTGAARGRSDDEDGEEGVIGRRATVIVTVAEVTSVAREGGDISAFTLLGRYRGEIRLCALLPARHGHLASAAPTLVLPTEGFERVPREYGDMCAHHLPWTTRRFDAAVLARRAQQRYARIFPRVRVWQGTPERVSFWMAAHLPIDSREKQDLLELPTLCARLHQVIAILDSLDSTLCCAGCQSQISSTEHMVSVTQEGPGGIYVNEHGYVHDMMCLKDLELDSIITHGSPETANSWFPGYAWTCMSCRVCQHHLGWLFTKAVDSVQPAQFWGVRRMAVEHGEKHASDNDSDPLAV